MLADTASVYIGGRLSNQEIQERCGQRFYHALPQKYWGTDVSSACPEEYKPTDIRKKRILGFGEKNSLDMEASNPEGKGYVDVYGSAEAYIQGFTTLFVDSMRFAIEEDDAAIIVIDGSGVDEYFFLDAYEDEFLDELMFEAGYYDKVENILDFPDEATPFVCEKLLETMRMCWMIGINNTRLDRDVFLPKALKNLGLDTGFFAGQFQIFEKGKATLVIPHSSSAPLPYMLDKAKDELRNKGKSFIWQPDSLVGYPV